MKITIFTTPVELRMSQANSEGVRKIAAVLDDGSAFNPVMTYDDNVQIVSPNSDNALQMIEACRKKTGDALGVLGTISDYCVTIVRFFVNVIKGFLGSFVGFGLFGIVFIIFLMLISLAISIYAFLFVAPFLAFSWFANWSREQAALKELAKLLDAGHQIASEQIKNE